MSVVNDDMLISRFGMYLSNHLYMSNTPAEQ